jgi:peptidoglycan hydrolase-like protein with peptidoglycan-binding domain
MVIKRESLAVLEPGKTDKPRVMGVLRRRVSLLINVGLVLVALGAGWWAGRVTLTGSNEGGVEAPQQVVVEVTQGSVGRTLGVGVTVRQPVEVVATNTLYGMVTFARAAGEVNNGDVVFQVAGAPVRVVAGTVPFYRGLSSGARGADVAQLNEALVALGYLASGNNGDYFGTATYNAVRAWQQALGVERTGAVPLGEVLAVPQLPTVIRLGEAIRTGQLVSGGEAAVLASSGAQEFALVLSSDQSNTITNDVALRVFFEDLVWEARSVGSRMDASGYTARILAAVDGGAVCGADCARLPADEQLSLRAEAIVIPEVSGATLPVGAVRTAADGGTYVRLADGTERDIKVLGSGQGIAVVSGLEVGEQVIVYGE